MKHRTFSLLRRFSRDQRGQAAVILGIGMSACIGLAGIATESGHAYYAYQTLEASTNAATLAAQAMPNTTLAGSNATAYSSVSGQKNATPMLTSAAVTTKFSCLTATGSTLNVPCQAASDGGSYNAVKVTQTAKVPSWFAGMFGITTFNFSYTATAAIRGGTASNWNIAIIMDTTGSMASSDGGTQCSGTKEACALNGMQTLLNDLNPCALGETCTSSTHYVDDVALYVFPPVTTATYTDDYCSGGSPSNVQNGYYQVPTLPNTGSPSYTPIWTYQIVNFSNDYKTSDAASTLNTSSKIVKATGYSGSSCAGLNPGGGAGTYYAQAIKQAQSDLASQQSTYSGSRNAMIILGDGDSTAGAGLKSGKSDWTLPANYQMTSSDGILPSATASLNGVTGNNPTSYTYPSAVGECGQAVAAAQAAAAAGTQVYTIGYGASNSGCTTDKNYSVTLPISVYGGAWAAGDSPCQALAAMASAPVNFFSDNGSGHCPAVTPSNAALTTLTAIFRQIVSGMTTPRLIPNGST